MLLHFLECNGTPEITMARAVILFGNYLFHSLSLALLYSVICVTKIHHSMSPGNGVSRERRKEEGGEWEGGGGERRIAWMGRERGQRGRCFPSADSVEGKDSGA